MGDALTDSERVDLEREAAELRKRLHEIGNRLRRSDQPWVVRDITVGNVAVPPPTEADRLRAERTANEHVPLITRTLNGGPGNHRKIRGCCCRDPLVRDAASWAAHVGVPGAGPFIRAIFALEDSAADVLDHPGDGTTSTLNATLRSVGDVFRKPLA